MTVRLPLRPLLLLVVVGAGLVASLARCAEPQKASAEQNAGPTLRFRRFYVPEGRLDEWVRENAIRCLPRDRVEFERLVAMAQKAGGLPRASAGATVVAAEYRARLEEDALVDGTAWLDVVHLTEGPAMLPLDPCGLAIGTANWAGRNGQVAKLGLGVDGKQEVLVEQSGRLEFQWSLRGRRDGAGTLRLPWEVPPSPINWLVLTLPDDLKPVSDQGVVVEVARHAQKAQSREDLSGDEVSIEKDANGQKVPIETSLGEEPIPVEKGLDGEKSHQWRIELGGHHHVAIRIVPRNEADQPPPATRVHQSMKYDVSRGGMDLQADFEFDVQGQPLRQAAFLLDPQLRLANAWSGSTPVPWTIVAPPPGSKATPVVIEFPTPIQNTKRVRLRALAPLELDRRWRLPGIRPEGTFWQSGEATLTVSAPLLLEQLVPVEGRQTTALRPAVGSGETVRLQYFEPDARLEVLVTESQTVPEVDCGTTVEVRGREMTGTVTAEFYVSRGECSLLQAEVRPQWDIDSVESLTPEVPVDWLPPGKRAGSGRKLIVHLGKALSPSQSVQLRITARRPRPSLGQGLRIKDLTPVRFEASAKRPLMWLRPGDAYEVKFTDTASLKRIDPLSLEETALALFGEPPGPLLFEDNAETGGVHLSLEARKPSYSAAIRVEATVSDLLLTESYRFRCVPETGQVDRVRVRWSHARTTPLRWALASGDEGLFSARRLPSPKQAAHSAASGGETWEIHLREPRSEPFEILASRTTELGGQQPVSLAWLPEATGQRATLLVGSTGSTAIRVNNAGLKPIPAPNATTDRRHTVRAAYRYEPAGASGPAGGATLTITPSKAAESLPMAWARSCRIESWYEASGIGRHLATFYLENAGLNRLRVTLPPATSPREVHEIWVDGTRVAWPPVDQQRQRVLAIELPPARGRFPVLSIRYATVGQPLGVGGAVACPQPGVNVPVLTRHWTVWLPPGYDAQPESTARQSWGPPMGSWPQRLFGPLGRPPDRRPFDPMALGDWRRLLGGRPGRPWAERQAGALLRRLGDKASLAASPAGPIRWDWGTLLAVESTRAIPSGAEGGPSELELLVDQSALSRMGLTPRTTIRVTPGEVTANAGAALLRRAKLALLAHPDAVVLTSATAAATRYDQLGPAEAEEIAPPENQVLWWIRPGPLSDRIERAAAGRPDPCFVPVLRWQEDPPGPPEPWSSRQPAGLESVDALGWAAYRLEASGEALRFVHRDTIRTLRWAAFLAVIGLAWWKAVHRPAALTGLVGLSAVAAFLLPQTYAEVASGAFWGSLFVVGVRLIRKKDQARRRSRSATLKPTTTQVASPVLAACALAVLWGSARCAEPPPERAASVRTYPVLIPVDGQGEPVGVKYYVPLDFWQKLRELAGAGDAEPQGWLLGPATYQGTLSWQVAPQRLVLRELKVAFDLEVRSPSAPVRIPFGPEAESLVLPEEVLLDGQKIQPEFQEGALVLEMLEPGPHRLELGLSPSVPSGTGVSGFDLTIPRVATSKMELTVPRDAPAIDVRSAVGSIRRVQEGGRAPEADSVRLHAELGPTDRLSVRWPEGGGRGALGPVVTSEELLWLRILPESILLDAKFKFKILEGRVDEFRLAADPRLRLLNVEGQGSAIVDFDRLPGQPETIRLKLAQPISDQDDQEVVEATFQVTGAPSVGNLHVPDLKALGVRPTKRWLAVSIDPSLVPQEQSPEELEQLMVPDFQSDWGDAGSQPDFAFNLPPGAPSWSLAVRPREPSITVDQTLALSFASKETEVFYDARLAISGGDRLQYRVSAPRGLAIETLAVFEAGIDRVHRYCRARDGAIIVFLAEGTGKGDQQELSIRGRLPSPLERDFALPLLQIDGAPVQSSVIQLFRKQDVRVEVLPDATGLVEVESPVVDPSRAPLGRLVKSFSAEGSLPVKATLSLRPNQPTVVVDRQTTRLRCEQGIWKAEVEFRGVSVRGGVLDRLLLEAPRQWSGPDQISLNGPDQIPLPASVEEMDAGALGRRQWAIRPSLPIEAEFRLQLAGSLNVVPGQRVTVPEIAIQGADLQQRILVLPAEAQGQPLTWETRGLRQTSLPDDSFEPSATRQPPVAYRVAGEPFQAVLRPVQGRPRVRFADVRLAWQSDGRCHGVTIFDVESAGTSECSLRLPPGCRLVQVLVAGVAVTPESDGGRRWRVPLVADVLAQRLAVLFTADVALPEAGGKVRFESPVLDEWSAPRTLWSVSGPSRYRAGRPQGLPSAGALEHDLRRLENVEALTQQAAAVPVGDSPEPARAYQRWARRRAALYEDVRRQLALAEANGEQRQLAEQRLLRLAEPRDLGTGATGAPDHWTSAERPGELWLRTLNRPRAMTRCVTPEGIASITLSYQLAEGQGDSYRLLWAAVIAGLTMLTIVGYRAGVLAILLSRWPHLLGVAVGLVWWLWLWPSVLGWGIVFVSLAASFRSRWRRSVQPRSGNVPLGLA